MGSSRVTHEGGTPPSFPFPSFNNTFVDSFLSILKSTSVSVDLVAFQFNFPQSNIKSPMLRIVNALKCAHSSGVKLRILLNSKFSNSFQYGSNHAAHKLFTMLGIESRLFPPSQLLHAKFAVFDGETAFIGSSNFTHTSLAKNVETNFFFNTGGNVSMLSSFFDTLWKEADPTHAR